MHRQLAFAPITPHRVPGTIYLPRTALLAFPVAPTTVPGTKLQPRQRNAVISMDSPHRVPGTMSLARTIC